MLATAIDGLPGPVVELGLGNGRTYDHLRQRLPDREIYVFERKVAAHPNCIPPDERLILGDMEETLESPRRHLPQPAAMIHSDIGTGDAIETPALPNGWRPVWSRCWHHTLSGQ
jgi:hypothetical protein